MGAALTGQKFLDQQNANLFFGAALQ